MKTNHRHLEMVPNPEAEDQAAVTPRALRISILPDLFHLMPPGLHAVHNQPLLAEPVQEWLPVTPEGCLPAYTVDAPYAGLLCDLSWKVGGIALKIQKAAQDRGVENGAS